jgi:hypothetical protein
MVDRAIAYRGANQEASMEQVVIDTGIPVPEPIIRVRYAFEKMGVGESMFFAELQQVE